MSVISNAKSINKMEEQKMKQLVCEMCGSSDLLKQDGVFVCQTCGTKYSVEEAKKMMVEGKVEVTGTVQIDKTNQIKGYLEVIERAYKGRDGKTAYEYSNKALEADPENPDVLIARAKAISLLEMESNALRNELMDIRKKIYDYYAKARDEFYDNRSEDDDSEFYNDVLFKLYKTFIQVASDSADDFCKFCHNTPSSNYKIMYDLFKQKAYQLSAYIFIIYSFSKKWDFDDEVALNSLNQLMEKCEECKKQFISYQAIANNIVKPSIPFNTGMSMIYDDIKELTKSQEEAKEKKNRERNEKYWLEHQEEKQQLEAEKNSLSPQIEELQKQITGINDKINQLNRQKESSIPAEDEYKSLKSKIFALKTQRDSLGIFKGKQKKELQAQIDEETSKLEHLNSEISSQKEQLLSSINPQISALNNKCSELEKELSNLKSKVSEIDTELTKQR